MEFLKTASNGLSVAGKQLSDVSNAAVSEFERFDCGINPTVAFAERMEYLLHRALEIERVGDNHGGVLPALPRFLLKCRRLPLNSRAKNPKWGS
jgi:hypothetical protein